jgi:hypothetical protein
MRAKLTPWRGLVVTEHQPSAAKCVKNQYSKCDPTDEV